MPLCCCGSRGAGRSGRSLLSYKFKSMREFRETSCKLAFMAIRDVFLLPVVLIALLCPTRTDVVLRAVISKILHRDSIEHLQDHEIDLAFDEDLRSALFWLGLTAPIDVAGIIAGSLCFMLPYPTALSVNIQTAFRRLTATLEGERRQHVVVSERSRMNTHLSMRAVCLLFLSSIEIVLFLLSIPFALLPPWYYTVWRLPVQSVFAVRIRGVLCSRNVGTVNSDNESKDNMKGEPYLLIYTYVYTIFRGLVDLFGFVFLVAPAIFLATALILAPYPTGVFRAWHLSLAPLFEGAFTNDDNFHFISLEAKCLVWVLKLSVRTILEAPLFILSIPFAALPPWETAKWLDPLRHTLSLRMRAAPGCGIRSNGTKNSRDRSTQNDDTFYLTGVFLTSIFVGTADMLIFGFFTIPTMAIALFLALFPFPTTIFHEIRKSRARYYSSVRERNDQTRALSFRFEFQFLLFLRVCALLFRSLLEILLTLLAIAFCIIPTQTAAGCQILKSWWDERLALYKLPQDVYRARKDRSPSNNDDNDKGSKDTDAAVKSNSVSASQSSTLGIGGDSLIEALVYFNLASCVELIVFATFGLFGLASCFACLLLPWPNGILADIGVIYRNYIKSSNQAKTLSQKFCDRVVFNVVLSMNGMLVFTRSLCEMLAITVLLPLLLLAPTLTADGLRMITHHFRERFVSTPCCKQKGATSEQVEGLAEDEGKSKIRANKKSAVKPFLMEMFSLICLAIAEICCGLTCGLLGLLISTCLLIIPWPTEVSRLIYDANWECLRMWWRRCCTSIVHNPKSWRDTWQHANKRMKLYSFIAVQTFVMSARTVIEIVLTCAALPLMVFVCTSSHIGWGIFSRHLGGRICSSQVYHRFQVCSPKSEVDSGTGMAGIDTPPEQKSNTHCKSDSQNLTTRPDKKDLKDNFDIFDKEAWIFSRELCVFSLLCIFELAVFTTLGLFGIINGLILFILPWPTEFLKIWGHKRELLKKNLMTQRAKGRKTDSGNQSLWTSIVRLRVLFIFEMTAINLFLLFRTILEMLLTTLVAVCMCLVPTQTRWGARVLHSHFHARTRSPSAGQDYTLDQNASVAHLSHEGDKDVSAVVGEMKSISPDPLDSVKRQSIGLEGAAAAAKYIAILDESNAAYAQKLLGGGKNSNGVLVYDLCWLLFSSCLDFFFFLTVGTQVLFFSCILLVIPYPIDLLKIWAIELQQLREIRGDKTRLITSCLANDRVNSIWSLQKTRILFLISMWRLSASLVLRTTVEMPLLILCLVVSLGVPTRAAAAWRRLGNHLWFRWKSTPFLACKPLVSYKPRRGASDGTVCYSWWHSLHHTKSWNIIFESSETKIEVLSHPHSLAYCAFSEIFICFFEIFTIPAAVLVTCLGGCSRIQSAQTQFLLYNGKGVHAHRKGSCARCFPYRSEVRRVKRGEDGHFTQHEWMKYALRMPIWFEQQEDSDVMEQNKTRTTSEEGHVTKTDNLILLYIDQGKRYDLSFRLHLWKLAWSTLLDAAVLPFAIIALSPLGWIGCRHRRLVRQSWCFQKFYNSQTTDTIGRRTSNKISQNNVLENNQSSKTKVDDDASTVDSMVAKDKHFLKSAYVVDFINRSSSMPMEASDTDSDSDSRLDLPHDNNEDDSHHKTKKNQRDQLAFRSSVMYAFGLTILDVLSLPLLLICICPLHARSTPIIKWMKRSYLNTRLQERFVEDIVPWHLLLLRQSLLFSLDCIFLPLTAVVFVTRWRWVSSESATNKAKSIWPQKVDYRLLKGKKISVLNSTAVDSADSEIYFHGLVLLNAILVFHDIVLVLVVSPILFASIYRAPRIYSLLYYESVKRDRLGQGGAWRLAIWYQLWNLLVDVICLPLALCTVIIAPHRVLFLKDLAIEISKLRFGPKLPCCCVSKKELASENARHASDGMELELSSQISSPVALTQPGPHTETHSTDEPAHNVSISEDDYPQWDGGAPINHPHASDGFWRERFASHLFGSIIDFPFLILSLPAILCLYRLDKILQPMMKIRHKKNVDSAQMWTLRLNGPYQSCRVVLDILCLPLAIFVFATIFRAPSALAKLFSKIWRPIDKPAILKMSRASVEIHGRRGVKRSTVSLHVEATLNLQQREQMEINEEFLIEGMRLRMFGSNQFWKFVKKKWHMGSLALYRLKSMMTIELVEANMNSKQIASGVRKLIRHHQSVEMDRSHRAAADIDLGGESKKRNNDSLRVPSLNDGNIRTETSSQTVAVASDMGSLIDEDDKVNISFTLSLFLPLEKEKIRYMLEPFSRSKSQFGFQVEVKNKVWKNLIANVVPIEPFLKAARRKDPVVDAPVATLAAVAPPSFYSGDEESEKGKSSFSPTVNIAAIPVSIPRLTPIDRFPQSAIGEPLPTIEAHDIFSAQRHTGYESLSGILDNHHRDARDSFAEIFALAFCSACFDIIHGLVALFIGVLAPWRFLVMIKRICEPRRRLIMRKANRYLSRIQDSFAFDFEPGRADFILAANEASKVVKDLDSASLSSAVSDADASLKTYLSQGSDLEKSVHFGRAKRRLMRHSEAMYEWMGRLERELKVDIWDKNEDNVDARQDYSEKNNTLYFQRVPFLRELKTWIGLKEAELYYTALNMQLNRARMSNLFPRPRMDISIENGECEQMHESFPCLVEELRVAHVNFQGMCTNAQERVVALKSNWAKHRLHFESIFEWGMWWKTPQEIRSLIRYYLFAGIEDLLYILLNLIIVGSVYRLPRVFRDLNSNVPDMSFGVALCSWLNPGGTYRVRRAITRKHVAGIIVDIRLFLENIALFIVVCLLVVRLLDYLSYLPFIKSGYDLRRKALESINESAEVIRGLFLLACLEETWVVAGKAVLFSVLMPAVSTADMLQGLLPCFGSTILFFLGIALWILLLFTPLVILGVVGEGLEESASLENSALGGMPPMLPTYCMGVLGVLILSAMITFKRAPKSRRVSTLTWSAPVLRLDQFPNLLCLLQAPLESGMIILAFLAAFNHDDEAGINDSQNATRGFNYLFRPNKLSWPSFAEDSSSGVFVRSTNAVAQILAFLWVFVLSVPLGLGMSLETGEAARIAKRKAAAQRREILQSSFYQNISSLLSGPFFLPMLLGLALPLHCVNNSKATNNGTLIGSASNITWNTTNPHIYTCWGSNNTGTTHHTTVVASSLVFILVLMLTNIASSVSSRASEAAALTAVEEKDNGLDIIYADSYSSGIKLMQACLVATALVGSLNVNVNIAGILFVVVSVTLFLWTPIYCLFVTGCRCPSHSGNVTVVESTPNIIASISWVAALRICGFACTVVFAAILILLPEEIFSADTKATLLVILAITFPILSLLVAAVVRRSSLAERQRYLAQIGLTSALAELKSIEVQLFQLHAFDALWSTRIAHTDILASEKGSRAKKLFRSHGKTKQSSHSSYPSVHDWPLDSISDVTAPARQQWLSHLRWMTDARMLGQAVLEFERHVLAENFKSEFNLLRKSWRDSLKMKKARESKNTNMPTSEKFAVIARGLKDLKKYIRPTPMTKIALDLVKIRMKPTFEKFRARGIKLSDNGDGSAVFVNKDKTPVVVASAPSAPSIPINFSVIPGSALFLDGEKRMKSKDSTLHQRIRRKTRKRVPVVPPFPPANVFSRILSFLGAEILADLEETPFRWNEAQSHQQRRIVSSDSKSQRSWLKLERAWLKRVCAKDVNPQRSDGKVYEFPSDLYVWLHAPTFHVSRPQGRIDWFAAACGYVDQLDTSKSRLASQVDCAQRMVAHIAMAVARRIELQESRRSHQTIEHKKQVNILMPPQSRVPKHNENSLPKKPEVLCRNFLNWKEARDSNGKKYWYNSKLGATSWSKPPRELKAGWLAAKDPQSTRVYYFNSVTSETSWTAPTDDDSWKCSACTLINSCRETFCTGCRTPKEVAVPDGKWICTECTMQNDADANVCKVCATRRYSHGLSGDGGGAVSSGAAKLDFQPSYGSDSPFFFSELVKVAPQWMLSGRTVGKVLYASATAVYAPLVANDTFVELNEDSRWASSVEAVAEVVKVNTAV